jgi:hypothetical protein
VPALNTLATKSFDASHTYSDVVHFVHINVVEPHPSSPDPSPYSGDVWENEYSRPQPPTYEARAGIAADLKALLVGNQTVLVDGLTPKARNNPLWCSYGPNPNSAYLIDRNGTLRVVQKWIDPPAMEAAIDLLLGR